MEPHLKLSSLAVDFLEIEPELLLEGKIPMDLILFSLFSTKASKPAEPMVAALSLFGFHVLDSVTVCSGLSGTTSRSSELRPVSKTLPNREVRDFALLDRVIIAPILSILSSSLGVGIEEELDAVIVGDSAGRLDLVISECALDRFSDLPRATSSASSLASLVVMLMVMGGGRLFSRRTEFEGGSVKLADEDEEESERRVPRGSTVSTEGIGGSACTNYRSTGGSGGRRTRRPTLSVSDSLISSSGMSGNEEVPGIEWSETGSARASEVWGGGEVVRSEGFWSSAFSAESDFPQGSGSKWSEAISFGTFGSRSSPCF